MAGSVLKEGPPESVDMDAVRLERLKKLAAGWVASGELPSLCVLVARRGTIVLHEAFGRIQQAIGCELNPAVVHAK